jgi:hypothetical protein
VSAQPAVQPSPVEETELLDADTSAAILHWMETGAVPPGIDRDRWERWADDGCRGRLEVGDELVTSAMLGQWARGGRLR